MTATKTTLNKNTINSSSLKGNELFKLRRINHESN